ncbi:hypothetical protein GOB57_21745 [Sinorhizobium meliloti]|nr:hypothetical protein [Sinorhizobium meliloti]
MTNRSFKIEDIRTTTEGRVFDACVELARRGHPTSFKLVVDELVTAAYTPSDGTAPRTVSKRLSFETDIAVRADTYVVLGDVKMEEEGDASSCYNDYRHLWIAGDLAWKREEPYFKTYQDPMTYLRLQAVQWATNALSMALDEPGANPDRAFDGVTEGIVDTIKEMAFQANVDGVEIATSLFGVPRLLIEPSPIWGPSMYLNLKSTRAPILDMDWKQQLLSFQLADTVEAERVRDALVREHCADYDPDYDCSWTDSGVVDKGDTFASRSAMLNAIRIEEAETPVLKGLRSLGTALLAAGLMNQDDKADFEVAFYEGGQEAEFKTVVAAVAERNPKGFDRFLEEAGWEFAFSPLDVAELRLDAKPTLNATSTPRP